MDVDRIRRRLTLKSIQPALSVGIRFGEGDILPEARSLHRESGRRPTEKTLVTAFSPSIEPISSPTSISAPGADAELELDDIAEHPGRELREADAPDARRLLEQPVVGRRIPAVDRQVCREPGPPVVHGADRAGRSRDPDLLDAAIRVRRRRRARSSRARARPRTTKISARHPFSMPAAAWRSGRGCRCRSATCTRRRSRSPTRSLHASIAISASSPGNDRLSDVGDRARRVAVDDRFERRQAREQRLRETRGIARRALASLRRRQFGGQAETRDQRHRHRPRAQPALLPAAEHQRLQRRTPSRRAAA